MWADSTKMSTNASRGAMMVQRLSSPPAANPAIYRFPTQIDISQNGIIGPHGTSTFPKTASQEAIIQINHANAVSSRKECLFLRKSTTLYWILSEILH